MRCFNSLLLLYGCLKSKIFKFKSPSHHRVLQRFSTTLNFNSGVTDIGKTTTIHHSNSPMTNFEPLKEGTWEDTRNYPKSEKKSKKQKKSPEIQVAKQFSTNKDSSKQILNETFYKWDGDTLVLNILGKPSAGKDLIGNPKGNQLKISVTAAPVRGRATDHMVNFLAPQFGVKPGDIEVVFGRMNVNKQLRIKAPKKLPWSDTLEEIV